MAAHLVQVHQQFEGNDDVVFIGLTDEEESELSDVRQFLRETGIHWLNGYGARETLGQFGHAFYPQRWIIGRDGRIAWNENSEDELEEAIEKALAAEESKIAVAQ